MNTLQRPRLKKRKLLILGVVVIALAASAWYLNNYVSLDELVEQERRLRENIALSPWRSFIIGFGIYTGLALVPGTGGKAVVYGWLFGFWQAMIIVSIGLTIAAMAIFSLSRYLFQESIERRYTSFLSLMNKHLELEGAFYLLALRMAHAPYSIVNPVSGASRVSSWTFFWTTVLGLMPANAIWVYVGLRLPSLRELVTNGANALIDLPLIATLVFCAILPILIRWMVGRFGISTSKIIVHEETSHESPRDKL